MGRLAHTGWAGVKRVRVDATDCPVAARRRVKQRSGAALANSVCYPASFALPVHFVRDHCSASSLFECAYSFTALAHSLLCFVTTS